MLSMRHAPLLITALCLAVLMAAAWPFTVDDAFISVRYAQRLAGGLGYTFSGVHASDGVTGPLWLLPLVAGAQLGANVVTLAKLLSAAAGLVAVGWLVVCARGQQRGVFSAWCVGLICASSLPLVAWSVAGLETGLVAAIVSWLAIAARAGRGLQAGLAVAALAWLRPELALFAAVLLASVRVRSRSAFARALVLALIGALAVLVFRYAMFGHALPMTASAKPPWLANGWHYLVGALTPRTVLLAAGLALALRYGDRVARVLGLAVLAHASAVLLAGGDWMPARRLFVPIVPVLAYALARGSRRLSLRHPRASIAALALLGIASAHELAVELPGLREAGRRRETRAPELARAACASGPIALIDVGVIGALCPDATLIDLAGLTEPAVAYARGGHLDKRIDESWLRAQQPAALVLHSRERPRVDAAGRLRWFAGYPVERRVLGFAFVRDYRVRAVVDYAPAYYYVILQPAGSPRQ